ncbi:MAG: hypothetical protein CUN55_06885 [Phototrophicales bacterium]|nr:MAG: hypothetical protein CUN55_06885 [Phototrophicales bacterium]
MSLPTDPQLETLFRAEANEHLTHMNQALLQVEAGNIDIDNAIHELFRAAHSLKGAARTVGYTAIEQLSHALESVFDAIRSKKITLSPDVADLLYDGLDSIQLLLENAEAQLDIDSIAAQIQSLLTSDEDNSPTLQSGTPSFFSKIEGSSTNVETRSASTEDSMRVALHKLDTIMLALNNLMIERMNIEQRVSDLQATRRLHQEWQQKWRRFHQHYIRLLREYDQLSMAQDVWMPILDFLRHTQQYMRTMGQQLNSLEANLTENSLSLGAITDALQENVHDVRLVPFESLTNLLQRTVRDSARALNKQVKLQIVGANIELDKQVLELLKDPLIHILRNAVDHGIELPAEREVALKQPDGLILISLFQKGNSVHIIISDDGRGIDLEQIRQRALALGIISPDILETLNDTELHNILMMPGFSTRQDISSFSGRGVGLDVVRDSIERLQGQMSISSQKGQWTTIELIVPVSLSTQHCLLVKVQQDIYAIPTTNVLRIIAHDEQRKFFAKGKPMLSVNENALPLYYLSNMLGHSYSSIEDDRSVYVIIAQILDRQYAFAADDVISEQLLLVRPLPPELHHIPLYLGATLLADGQVVLVLNIHELVKRNQIPLSQSSRSSTKPIPYQPKRHTILVVDDSITTRTLQKNILEAAGYEVISATHGLEALDILMSQHIDLVISDVEMPHLDGFELTLRIRQTPNLQQLPIILVTSLDSEAHKTRGIQVGADAYIPKGVFDQNELLNTIKAIL